MGTRSDIVVHLSDGTWKRIYCHWDGYLSHNGRILQEHYASQELAEALVGLGNLSSLGPKIGRKHPFNRPAFGTKAYDKHEKLYGNMCTAYIRDRGIGPWHFAKTKAEFLRCESGVVGDTLAAVWPEEGTWTEFIYVWDGKWFVGDPDEGSQTLRDLDEALLVGRAE